MVPGSQCDSYQRGRHLSVGPARLTCGWGDGEDPPPRLMASVTAAEAAPAPRHITVIGTGYLGITHAACMAALGFHVLGLDRDATKITRLSAGDLPIAEPCLEELLRNGLTTGRLRFTTSYQAAAAFGEVHFLCPGTPQRDDGGSADLSQLQACVAALAPLLESPCLVVGKSTVPVGTAAALAAEFARLSPCGTAVELAWNPEFLREGHAVQDSLHPDRIVAGVRSHRAELTLRHLYADALAAGIPFFVTDLATAELAKVAANAFLATKISFINAVSEVCEVADADITVLAQILGADPRIGSAYLRPGLGFGGGCLPKDIRAFQARAAELGAGQALKFLHEIDAINLRRRLYVANLARDLAGGSLAGVAVCVLGAAFKPGCDDVRDSPALDAAQILHGMGARVTVCDPAAAANARRVCPQLRYVGTAQEAAEGARLVLLLTEWPEFINLDPVELRRIAAAEACIIDARNVLHPDLWREAGWDYRALGTPLRPAFAVARHDMRALQEQP